jgi:hypothetical protein
LNVEATSTNTGATLTVYVTSTNVTIGALTNDGKGKSKGLLNWATNPVNIIVRSSSGGTATRAVTLK